MTAGPREVYDRCCPYFKAMGRNLFYFGDRQGAGQAAKLSNNLILAASMVGCAEGIRYASRHGLPLEELMSLLKVSTGNSWTVQKGRSEEILGGIPARSHIGYRLQRPAFDREGMRGNGAPRCR